MSSNLDNHEWREKWELIATLRFLWETSGPTISFPELIDMINNKVSMMVSDGKFEHESYSPHEKDGINRRYRAAMLALSEEIE